MLITKPTHSYVGRKSCGCAVSITVDMGDKFTAQSVKEMILDGLYIERVEFGTPEHFKIVDNLGCDCKAKQIDFLGAK